MGRTHRLVTILFAGAASATRLSAQDPDPGVVNWPAPLYWSPGPARLPAQPTEQGALRTKSSVPTSPLPFIGINPCRIANTGDSSFPPNYGPPSLSPGVANGRTFYLSGQCGIPLTASAVSLNITAYNPLGIGYIVLYPDDGSFPAVSTLNYSAGQTVANAAIVPVSTGGAIRVVAGISGTELIIDTNGYYGPAGVGFYNTFLGSGAGQVVTTGDNNTAMGWGALRSDTDGSDNTGSGTQALYSNTLGSRNSAHGAFALQGNTEGNDNTATGFTALYKNTTGNSNTATGRSALTFNTTGSYNTASGAAALGINTTGDDNTAIGYLALSSNTAGFDNTASGINALILNTAGNNNTANGRAALFASTGSGNIGLGAGAGSNLTVGDYNMYLGNEGGAATESNTVRIGSIFSHTRTFVAAVRGVTTDNANAVPVVIDSLGQLGTVSSSARLKQDVANMAEASSALMNLRPVTFRYKGRASDRKQFGLIAEEVETVLPELVVCDSSGEAETVLYHEMPAMLLNELQKQQRRIERQEEEIQALRTHLVAVEAGLSASAEGR